MYWKTEQNCRQFTKYMSYYIVAHQSIVMASFLYSVYCICVGNRDTSTWILAFNIVVPFNSQSIFGWYFKWFINLAMSISYALLLTSITSYFVCCCLYIHAICRHFHLIKNLIANNDKSIHKHIKQAVDIHVNVNE